MPNHPPEKIDSYDGFLRIALLTPYSGGNLGDAAIQDAVISNLRLRLQNVHFAGITLNSKNFLQRHGVDAFPLCASELPYYAADEDARSRLAKDLSSNAVAAAVARAVKRVPGIRRYLTKIRRFGRRIRDEFQHCLNGYRFLRGQDILIVSGGGQLDEEWGGPSGHPFTLFKWAIIARVARIPYVMVSVGAGKLASKTSRFLVRRSMQIATYRSYRDELSRQIASHVLADARKDAVVPDLAFSLRRADLPESAHSESVSRGRVVVALSLIAYARPQTWPQGNQLVYEKYLERMASLLVQLLDRGYFPLILWSSQMDERTIGEVLGRLDPERRNKLILEGCVPAISDWADLFSFLEVSDCVIASRLHSLILGFVAKKPAVAISFDRKVDSLMGDLDLSEYLLPIGNFEPEAVIRALERIASNKTEIVDRITAHQKQSMIETSRQYDLLASLATSKGKTQQVFIKSDPLNI